MSSCRVIRLLLSSPSGRMKSPAWSVMMGGHRGQVELLSGSMTHWPDTRPRRVRSRSGGMMRTLGVIDNCRIFM